MTKLKRGMSEEDRGIAERLEKLQKDRKVLERLPSDSEMADRLAALKGVRQQPGTDQNPQSVGFYHAPENNVPDAARADQLMSRISEEVSLDKKAPKADPAMDIAERLAKLRGLSVSLKHYA